MVNQRKELALEYIEGAMFNKLVFICSFSFFLGAQNIQLISGPQNLNASNGFVYVDLEIPAHVLSFIDRTLKVDAQKSYDRFGDLNVLKHELPAFLRAIGNDDERAIQTVTEIILETALKVAKACGKETAWVCVRSFVPSPAFDQPRWHVDGYYYPLYSGFPVKFVAALKGPQTLFYRLPEELRETFIVNERNQIALNKLLDGTKAESPNRGFGAFFIVGDEHASAIHSEPPIHTERLFFSVLPGDKAEIDELYTRWHPLFLINATSV